MIKEIKDLFKEVEQLGVLLATKGYTNVFHTSIAYQGSFKEIMERYLYQSMLSDEKGLQRGAMLRTFAEPRNDQIDYVKFVFEVERNPKERLNIAAMSIEHKNPRGEYLNVVRLTFTSPKQIPTKREAIDKVTGKQTNVKKRKGIHW